MGLVESGKLPEQVSGLHFVEDDLRAVLLQFLRRVLDIAAGAPAAAGRGRGHPNFATIAAMRRSRVLPTRGAAAEATPA